MNIVLMGYRGSGKTTIGRVLAERTWREFRDTDEMARKAFGGRTIRDIWETDGEAAFRDAECRALAECLAGDEQVIALGGGTVMRPEARQALAAAPDTTRIYLRCLPEVLFDRIRGDTSTGEARPALSPAGGTLDEVRDVLAQRTPIYEALADKTFDVTHVTAEDAVGHIIRRCL